MNLTEKPESISIIGCGWFGFEIAKTLVSLGHQVKGSTTTVDKLPLLALAGIKPYLLEFEADKNTVVQDFFDSEILIISIPPKRHSGEVEQYTEKIKMIAQLAVLHQVKKVIFTSSTSVYGDVKETLTELSPVNPQTTSGRQVLQAEKILSGNPLFATTVLRFSGLVGPGRHPSRFFTGKKNVPNGKAPINLVHLEDCIGLTLQIINLQAFGYTFNASTPSHPEKQLFYTAAAKAAHLEEPQFIDELKEWKIISSIQVLKHLKYNYKITDWMEWISAFRN